MNEKQKPSKRYTLETAFTNNNNRYTYLAMNSCTPHHTHEDFFEFFYVVSGGIRHIIDGQSEQLLAGDAYLFRPSDCHEFRRSPNAVRYSHRDVYVSIADMKEFCRFASPKRDLYNEIVTSPTPLRFYLTYHDIRAFETQAIRLSTLEESDLEHCYRSVVLSLLNLCLTKGAPSHYPQWLHRLIYYIHASVTRKRTLAEYVETTGYCHEHVSREFKRYTGYRLNEYIMRTKLEYAKSMLSQKEGNSVSQISYGLGFSDESSFITAFKKLYGISPMQWKKAIVHGKKQSDSDT